MDKIKNYLQPFIEELGFTLEKVSFHDSILEVVIDKDGFVTLDDISKVSQVINEKLDENDLIDSNYMLDISSLGGEKEIKLDKLPIYVNSYVCVVVNEKNKEKTYRGTLISYEDDVYTLDVLNKHKHKEVKINKDELIKANLAFKI